MDFLALRLNADGSRDSGFGSDGFVRTPIDYVPGAANWASAVALGPDASIVLAGSALDDLFTSDFAFVRYTSAGELDPTFSSDGIQTIDVDDYDGASGVAVQPSDGKIVAVGRSAAFDQTFTAMRLNADGTLDDSFGSGGVSRMAIGESYFDTPSAVALTPSGTILAAGTADDTEGHGDFALVRYLSDGQPDPAFGDGGVAITHDPANEHLHSLALAPDGKALVSGIVNQEGHWRLRVERYLPDGHLDPTFGGSGIVTTAFGSDSLRAGVTVQADGRAVASVTVVASARFGLVRYTVDGAIDPTFGGGTRVYEFGTGGATPSAVAIQGGGSPVPERIIEVGRHYDASSNRSDMAAIRVLTGPPGQPPPPPPPPPLPPPPPPSSSRRAASTASTASASTASADRPLPRAAGRAPSPREGAHEDSTRPLSRRSDPAGQSSTVPRNRHRPIAAHRPTACTRIAGQPRRRPTIGGSLGDQARAF